MGEVVNSIVNEVIGSNESKFTITKIDDDSAEISTIRDGHEYKMTVLLFTEEEVDMFYDITEKLEQEGKI